MLSPWTGSEAPSIACERSAARVVDIGGVFGILGYAALAYYSRGGLGEPTLGPFFALIGWVAVPWIAGFVVLAPRLLDPIADGADLVIGSRALGGLDAGAMSTTQVFGNRLATALIRWLWGLRVTDLGPYRAVRTDALSAIGMRDAAFGWTVEMQVKAIQQGMQVVEVPVDTRVRIGKSKISGTVRGVLGAGFGILSMIAKLRWQQREQRTVGDGLVPSRTHGRNRERNPGPWNRGREESRRATTTRP